MEIDLSCYTIVSYMFNSTNQNISIGIKTFKLYFYTNLYQISQHNI